MMGFHLIFFFLLLFFQISSSQKNQLQEAPSPRSDDLQQIDDLCRQFANSVGEIPRVAERIALFHIKMEGRGLPQGLESYLTTRLETILRQQGRRTIIHSPKMKTTRIIATDTSFTMSNTLPDIDELWEIGKELGVDAFMEGTLSKVSDGDLVLNLKIFQQRSAEVLWSGSFLAGKAKKAKRLLELELGAALTWRYYPVKSYTKAAVVNHSPQFGLGQYGLDIYVGEAANQNKNMFMTLNLGWTRSTAVVSEDTVNVNLEALYSLHYGIELLGVFFRKPNQSMGYWLGTFLGYKELIPFLYTGRIPMLQLGYQSRLTTHFTVRAVLSYLPFNRLLRKNGETSSIKLGATAYEISFLHFTF